MSRRRRQLRLAAFKAQTTAVLRSAAPFSPSGSLPLTLLLFEGLRGDVVVAARLCWVASCSWKPIFQQFVTMAPMQLDGGLVEVGAPLPPMPFYAVPSCEDFVDGLNRETWPSETGRMRVVDSRAVGDEVLRSPAPDMREQDASWQLAALDYDFHCLAERRAPIGQLLVKGRRGQAVRIDKLQRRASVQADLGASCPQHDVGMLDALLRMEHSRANAGLLDVGFWPWPAQAGHVE